MADKVAHLQMIQSVIQRMAQNSFTLRGWCVAIVAALFALAAKDANTGIAWIALIPIAVFAFLDAYYLYQERRFRSLFDAVAGDDPGIREFSMDVSSQRHLRLWRSLGSLTLVVFYLALMISTFALVCFLSPSGAASKGGPASANATRAP